MSEDLEFIGIDPFDAETYDQWYDCYAAAERADRGPQAPLWTREESRSELQQVSDRVERRALIARRAGEVVAAAKLGMPLKDNTHRAGLGVYVPPAFRRRGIGSAMLAEVERQALTTGRRTFAGESSWDYALGEDGAGAPGREFARRHGYGLALGDVIRRLPLPVPDADLDRLAASVADRHRDYTVRSWTGPVPDDLVAGWSALDAALETEAPTGELDLVPATPDVAAVREQEKLLIEQHRVSYGTVAVDQQGAVAAYTEIVVSGDDGNAYQWGTLVRAADRGHRLGLAVKINNLRRLQQEAPDAPAVITFNADSNTHMNAVNADLGFVPVERMGEFQKQIPSP